MQIATTIEEVRTLVKSWKKEGNTVGLVPTMGYLHEGHGSLISRAREENDKVVVSIFVNPMQFGPGEDLESYPRDLEKDSAYCESLGADLIFHPEPSEMYTEGFCSYVDMSVLTEELCGLSRPVHFRGVCTVVNKLFNIVQPDRAYFGQKDAHLSAKERQAALVLSRAVKCGQELVEAGETDAKQIVAQMKALIEKEPLARIDYVKAVDGLTMQQIDTVKKPMLVALAVYIGKTRLIDNFMV